MEISWLSWIRFWCITPFTQIIETTHRVQFSKRKPENMKSSLQFLYLFLKINGLIPFKFDFDKQEAIHTATSFRYSVIFSLIFWSYLTYYVCVICTSIISVEKEVLLMSVVLIDIIAAFFKTLCVYIIQLVNSRKIVESINSLMKLCEEIFGKDFRLTSCFSDSNLRRSCLLVYKQYH